MKMCVGERFNFLYFIIHRYTRLLMANFALQLHYLNSFPASYNSRVVFSLRLAYKHNLLNPAG